MAEPVADATTTVTVDDPGTYSVRVRTTDWCPGDWDAPDWFEVAIDGETLSVVFGTEAAGAGRRAGRSNSKRGLRRSRSAT